MNKTLILFKTMFRSENLLEIKSEQSSRLKGILKVVGMLAILLLAGASFAPIIVELYTPLAIVGMEPLLLKLLLFSASFIVLIFGFFYVMSVFYYSSDIENYLFLPVLPGSLVLAKFMVVSLYQILSTLVLFFPSFIAFGYMDQQNWTYYFKTLLALIILPIVPLTIIAILCILLMRFSKIFRNKDRFTLFSSLIGITIAISISALMQNLTTGMNNGIPAILQEQGKVFNILSAVFPAATLMHKAIFGGIASFILNTTLSFLICAVFIFIFYQVGNRLYIDGAKGLKETAANRKTLSQQELRSSTRKKSAVIAIASKELKMILRTPAYFLNCVLVSFIMPLFLILPLLFGGTLKELTAELGAGGIEQLRHMVSPDAFIIGLMALMAFYAGLNLIAATAITREGSNFSFMKLIPIPYRTQLVGKILPALVVQMLGVLILLIPAIILLRPSIQTVLTGFLLGLLLSIFLDFAMITLDVIRPVLDWTNEQKAVKQNFNAMVSTFLSMIVGAIPVVLFIFLPLDPRILFGIFFVVLVILNSIIWYLLPTIAERSFQGKP
ncbi:MAG: hypothetical protein GX833_02125 [Clostridium sp.]|jgi:ABC-2 type transport system permease protein|nr:hypothetical protein [Clostridium sp.]